MESEIQSVTADERVEPHKPVIPLTRRTTYILFLASLLFPSLIVTGYCASVGTKGVYLVAFFSSCLAGGGGWYLLKLWEQKMQRSVNELVKKRLSQMPSSKLSVKTELSSSQIALYEEQIHHLKAALDETHIGYEHKINLMHSSVAKSKGEVQKLNLEMDKKLEEMRMAYLEFEDLRKEYHRLEEEQVHFKQEVQKKLKHKDALIAEYQRTISEQRGILEKKQRYISKLEGKIRDLMYEIRSLLQLENSSNDSPAPMDMNEQAMRDYYLPNTHAPKPYDLSEQLKRAITKAESLTGMDHLGYVGGNSPRFLDMSESYAVDLRRLLDSFKDETAGALYIYSLSEKKFLFVNQSIKNLVGWSPEKFIKDFQGLTLRGYTDWEEALKNISTLQETRLELAFVNKAGKALPFGCYMGILSKGPFTGHVMGLFASA